MNPSSLTSFTFRNEQKIPMYAVVVLVCSAALIDLIQAVLAIGGVGEIADGFIADGIEVAFFIVFQIYGVSYTKPNNFLITFGLWVAENIPIVEAIVPGLTITVLWLCWQNRKEMRMQEKEMLAAQAEADEEQSEAEAMQAASAAAFARYAERENEEEEALRFDRRTSSSGSSSNNAQYINTRPMVHDIRPAMKKAV